MSTILRKHCFHKVIKQMSKREEFIEVVNTFKIVSHSITDTQRRGLLRQAVQNYDLSIEEASEILKSLGLMVGDELNYFEVLELSIEDLQNQSEDVITTRIDAAHQKYYSDSLRAGGLPRPDGRTQEQWRTVLNQARDTLMDPQKRNAYLDMLLSDGSLLEVSPQNLANPQTEVQETVQEISNEEVSNLPTTEIKSVSSSDLTTIPPDMVVPEDMVFIPAGEFQMSIQAEVGKDRRMTEQTVYLGAFFIDKYPVTNTQYKKFLDANPEWQKNRIFQRYHDGSYLQTWSSRNYPRGQAVYPVVDVSWYAAMAYAAWVGKRLPTEAEWEKAARGGLVGKRYPWGDEIDLNMANYGMQSGSTTPVGKYPPNDYGMYDAAGNVWEWCLDEHNDNSTHSIPNIAENSLDELTKNYLTIETARVLKGGSWASSERATQIAYFGWAAPNFTRYNYGFRCIKEISL